MSCRPYRASILAVVLMLSLIACNKPSDAQVNKIVRAEPVSAASSAIALDVTPSPGPLPSLAQIYKPFFPFGVAITPGQVMISGNPFMVAQFNMVVGENSMKPALLNRDGPGKYDFANADAMVNFANKNGMKVRGHALVWHQQAADWMFSGSGPNGVATREELISRMRTYIFDVVKHFKGRVHIWDVVNEAFVPDEPTVEQVGGWRKSNWYKIIGPDFIALAFQFAHEADPDAILVYNDYSTDSPKKRALILELIRDLQKRGITIHAIGHQSHYTVSQPSTFDDLEKTIIEVGKLGLQNQITELDISMNADLMKDSIDEITPELEQLQASRYHDFMLMCLRHRKIVSAFLVWGMNDDVSWLLTWPFKRLDAPLLFDGEFKPKPAFWALVNLGKKYPR